MTVQSESGSGASLDNLVDTLFSDPEVLTILYPHLTRQNPDDGDRLLKGSQAGTRLNRRRTKGMLVHHVRTPWRVGTGAGGDAFEGTSWTLHTPCFDRVMESRSCL